LDTGWRCWFRAFLMRGITLWSKEIAIANVVAFHGDRSFRMDDLACSFYPTFRERTIEDMCV